ncbi:MAG TPA: DUF883 domain-containing protein [Methylomirabilota bacterium]|nr:DUF883 domain-containing protein [Methylomirabilota bacterium]
MNPEATKAGEALLRDAADQLSTTTERAKDKAKETLEVTKAKLAEAQAALTYQTRRVAELTDEYARENTWKTMGIAAGVGLIVGLLLRRR